MYTAVHKMVVILGSKLSEKEPGEPSHHLIYKDLELRTYHVP